MPQLRSLAMISKMLLALAEPDASCGYMRLSRAPRRKALGAKRVLSRFDLFRELCRGTKPRDSCVWLGAEIELDD